MQRLIQPLAIVSLCLVSTAAWAGGSKEASTSFFQNHPNQIDMKEDGNTILFANRKIGLEFSRSEKGFELKRLYGIAQNQDFLTEADAGDFRNIFEIMMTLDPRQVGRDDRGKTGLSHRNVMKKMAGDDFVLGPQADKPVSIRLEEKDSESILHLQWTKLDIRDEVELLDVEVIVTLKKSDPLSYWRMIIRNRSKKYGIERVRFPILPLAPIDKAEDNVFVFPKWRGGLMEDPFNAPAGFGNNYHTQGASYPHYFNMQFQALYNARSGKGIYLGTQDSTPNMMNIKIVNTPSEITWRPGHFPPNITFGEEDYVMSYDCVAGPFAGDWYDASQIYREWATKQSWCSKGPLTTRKDIPKWYKECPLVFWTTLADNYTGTTSAELNMPIAADHFREFLRWAKMPLLLNLYSWSENVVGETNLHTPFNRRRVRKQGRFRKAVNHDAFVGSYPKIPALHNLAETCKSLRKEGGMINPYLILTQFDQGADENSPYVAEAKEHMSRCLYGSILKYSGYHHWLPCPQTQWWKDRMVETCEQMMDRENVAGFYLDVMHGMSKPCYWTPHGHSAAGGSSMTVGMHEISESIRDAVKAKDREAITTGEDSTENMIDVIDGLLYQRTLRPENKAPLFAAVYQDYIPRYGMELSVSHVKREAGGSWSKDHFFIECASLFVEGAQIGRIRLRPRDKELSFQKPEHKPMLDYLDMFLDYYRQKTAKNFLVYGRLLRPLEFKQPSPMPMLPYKFNAEFPALTSGVFGNDDGDLCVFVVNAGTEKLQFSAQLDPARYEVPAGAKMDVYNVKRNGDSKRIQRKASGTIELKGTLEAHDMKMFLLKH